MGTTQNPSDEQELVWGWYRVGYYVNGEPRQMFVYGSSPDAAAEYVLWIHEDKVEIGQVNLEFN